MRSVWRRALVVLLSTATLQMQVLLAAASDTDDSASMYAQKGMPLGERLPEHVPEKLTQEDYYQLAIRYASRAWLRHAKQCVEKISRMIHIPKLQPWQVTSQRQNCRGKCHQMKPSS